MTFNGRVEGGTGGGRKRSMLAAHQEWGCDCPVSEEEKILMGGRRRPGWLANCKDCGARGPS